MNALTLSSHRSRLRPNLSVRWRGALIISIPVIWLFASIFAIAGFRSKTITALDQKEQSRKTICETNRLLTALINVETGVRGYVLTHRPEFLNPYSEARSHLTESLESLTAKTQSHPKQRQQFQKIPALAQQQMMLLEQILKTADSQGATAVSSPVLTNQLSQSKVLMDNLRQEIAAFADQEEHLQSDRTAEVLRWRKLTNALQYGVLLMGLVASAAAWYLFNQLDQELMEQASRLRESNVHLRAVFDNVVDGILILNERGYIQSTNAAAVEIFGYQPDELMGKHLQRLIAESFTDDSGRVMSSLMGNNQDKLRLQQETVGRHKDGKTFPMEFVISEMPLDNEQLLIAIMRDITERKQAEVALRESEDLYRTLVKNFPNGAVFLFDQDLRYTIAEGTALATVNLNSEKLLGKTSGETFPPQTTQLLEPIYQDALVGKATVTEIPFAECLYRVHVLPVFNEQGKVFSGMAMMQDITKSKQAEDALRSRAEELARLTSVLAQTTASLEKRNTELDQFAYIVSHDLKAPLRAIANLSQWIEEDLEERLTEDTRHQMNLLRARVHRMEALINGLLQYSRVGRLRTELEAVHVEELLEEVIDSLAPPPEFTVQVMPGMPTLLTERLPLEQVFANLISNAIKHNHRSDGQIVISVTDKIGVYEFAVADDGPGIAPEFHEKVFIMFQTLESRDTLENTGVGLAIVKKIIEDQGGTIFLESEQGQGTIFRFTWPKHPRG